MDENVQSVEGGEMAPLEKVGRRWALGLMEPLLALELRVRYEREFEAVCVSEPGWAAMFLSGLVSDMLCSLPAGDPWRDLSARAAGLCRGKNPPAVTGAVRGDGRRFGTVKDAEDNVVTFGEIGPDLDVALCALVPSLGGEAAAILAFGADGWEACQAAISAVQMEAVAGSGCGRDDAARVAGRVMYTAGTAAVRWAVHRRVSYFEAVDFWPIDSATAWAWRADKMRQGLDWLRAAADADLKLESIEKHAVAAGQVLKVDFPVFGNGSFGSSSEFPDDF